MKKYFISNNFNGNQVGNLECDMVNIIMCFVYIFVIVLTILFIFGQNQYTIVGIVLLVLVGIFIQFSTNANRNI